MQSAVRGPRGPIGPTGPQGPVGPSYLYEQMIWVDGKNGNDANNGGIGAPKKTIQAGLNAINDAANLADNQRPATVFVMGGVYDEDLVTPRGRLLSLIAVGTVILGNGLGANHSSTNARSITMRFFNAFSFGANPPRPAFTLGTLLPADSTSTFLAQSNCWRISGALIVSGDGVSHTVNLHGVEVNGTFTTNSAGLMNLQAYRTYFKGALSLGVAAILQRAIECQFDALLTINTLNQLVNCEVKAGITVTQTQNTVPPSGIFLTTITGAFTGPAGSCKLDPVSNYYFKANGATLGGSATKVIIGDTTA